MGSRIHIRVTFPVREAVSVAVPLPLFGQSRMCDFHLGVRQARELAVVYLGQVFVNGDREAECRTVNRCYCACPAQRADNDCVDLTGRRL